jgi:hypothetical protein
MNRHKIAAALRELADAFEEDEPAPLALSAPKKRRAPMRVPPAPKRPPSELDMQRAENELRRLGYRPGKGTP